MTNFNDLKNEEDFPTWNNLPYEWDFSPSHHTQSRGRSPGARSIATPKRHWCLLGEIQHFDNFLRYRTIVNDDNGKVMIVAFYLDDYNGFDFDKLKKGHTMAIMYAHQHGFVDGTHGVRVEILEEVQVSRLYIPEGC